MTGDGWFRLASAAALAAAAWVQPPPGAGAQESGQGGTQGAGLPEEAVVLPEGIVWETNDEDPLIGSTEAIRGGTFNYFMGGLSAHLPAHGSQLK